MLAWVLLICDPIKSIEESISNLLFCKVYDLTSTRSYELLLTRYRTFFDAHYNENKVYDYGLSTFTYTYINTYSSMQIT